MKVMARERTSPQTPHRVGKYPLFHNLAGKFCMDWLNWKELDFMLHKDCVHAAGCRLHRMHHKFSFLLKNQYFSSQKTPSSIILVQLRDYLKPKWENSKGRDVCSWCIMQTNIFQWLKINIYKIEQNVLCSSTMVRLLTVTYLSALSQS